MLATFIVALREGVEASLIIGIIAAFLVKENRQDALRAMWIGIAAALVLCVAFGYGVAALDATLPQRQQEGLETIIALTAVAAITYMIAWMRNNSATLRSSLEHAAAGALAVNSTRALVAVAFLAVLREGFETVVFVLAVFQNSTDIVGARIGVAAGLAAAACLGYAVYRGGVKLHLAKFFRATGIVLVLVAAGLVASGIHTAHEAGWIDVGQRMALDLHAVINPGSVFGALMTAMFGIQPKPTIAELIAWLVYAIPLFIFTLSPRKRTSARS